MANNKVKILKVKCKKCKEKWTPRTAAPKKCPFCQSRGWDKPAPVYRRKATAARRAKKRR